MADSVKQTPLGVNCLGSYLSNSGLTINEVVTEYVGSSKKNSDYSFGKLLSETALKMITWSIDAAFPQINSDISPNTYNNLISIGSSINPALGNAKPSSYVIEDPTGTWAGEINTGYPEYSDLDYGQFAKLIPYNTSNPNDDVTRFGWLRNHALQAWNEFNWNGTSPDLSVPEYSEFLHSFQSLMSSVDYSNQTIMTVQNSKTYLNGTFSNMDDLITADISGVSLATKDFGTDLDNLGFVIDLTKLDSLGLPSVLLQTIYRHNALIQDLSLVLVLTEIPNTELEKIINGKRPSLLQEKKIYEAFGMITGDNLEQICSSLYCKTSGLNNLTDLLNVKKLFPNSYQSLTVPKYNSEPGLPTNSKTYYPIFSGGTINSGITTDEMNEYVGVQIPMEPLPTMDRTTESVYLPDSGFGRYLYNILPEEQAIASGALQFSLRQVPGIESVNIRDLAKSITSLEGTDDLPLLNDISSPTDTIAIDNAVSKLALGTGPYGTYTMSDVLGSMSGLPYPWKKIKDLINQIETAKLKNIYQQMYLAVSWEAPNIQVICSEEVIGPDTYYTPVAINVLNPGGGYSRGSAVPPTITLSNGGAASVVIGDDDNDSGPNGTFGRIKNIVLTSPGTPALSIPTWTIEYPPLGDLPVQLSGQISVSGVNSAFSSSFPDRDSVVQNYIDQANEEIVSISEAMPDQAEQLNTFWNLIGTQLMIEHRTRFHMLGNVPIPTETSSYPASIISFVDSLQRYSMDTAPHMSAQTLEYISDRNSLGGQSTIGAMRQSRNQARLGCSGISMNDTISNSFDEQTTKALMVNGSVPYAVNNGINGQTNLAYTELEPSGEFIMDNTSLTGTYSDGTEIQPGIPVVALPDELSSVLPVNLQEKYLANNISSSVPDSSQAVEKVNSCNCDCWVE